MKAGQWNAVHNGFPHQSGDFQKAAGTILRDPGKKTSGGI